MRLLLIALLLSLSHAAEVLPGPYLTSAERSAMSCIPLTRCYTYLALYRKRNEIPFFPAKNVTDLLRSLNCGMSGKIPKVRCPNNYEEPNGYEHYEEEKPWNPDEYYKQALNDPKICFGSLLISYYDTKQMRRVRSAVLKEHFYPIIESFRGEDKATRYAFAIEARGYCCWEIYTDTNFNGEVQFIGQNMSNGTLSKPKSANVAWCDADKRSKARDERLRQARLKALEEEREQKKREMIAERNRKVREHQEKKAREQFKSKCRENKNTGFVEVDSKWVRALYRSPVMVNCDLINPATGEMTTGYRHRPFSPFYPHFMLDMHSPIMRVDDYNYFIRSQERRRLMEEERRSRGPYWNGQSTTRRNLEVETEVPEEGKDHFAEERSPKPLQESRVQERTQELSTPEEANLPQRRSRSRQSCKKEYPKCKKDFKDEGEEAIKECQQRKRDERRKCRRGLQEVPTPTPTQNTYGARTYQEFVDRSRENNQKF